MASILAYTKARIDTLLATKATLPSGGSDGQALVKSGAALVWATLTGGGSTTDASQITSGTLPAARIADGSIADAKLASGTSLTSAERTKLSGIATAATANRTDSATDALIAAKATQSGVAGFVNHDGTTGGGTRPSGFGYVVWRGGSTRPTNMVTGDDWVRDA